MNNTAENMLDDLKFYFKAGSDTELSEDLGVARNTISGWRKRNAVGAIRKLIFKLDLSMDVSKYSTDKDLVSPPIISVPLSPEIKTSSLEETLRIKMEKLLLLASGTDNLDMLEALLFECRKKLLEKSFNEIKNT